MSKPLAYFITISTYGSWLHGSEKGSVDRHHNMPGTPFLSPDATLQRQSYQALRQPPYILDEPRRRIVMQTICEVTKHRTWTLWALHVRSNHVHVVITTNDVKPEKVMSDLKAWCSRRLREALHEDANRDRWTQHGSTRYLNDDDSFHHAVKYVLEEQGDAMEVYDGRN